MLRQSVYIVLLFSILGCMPVKQARHLFVNKTLIYAEGNGSSAADKEKSSFNSFFIAYDGRTIVQVDYPYDFMEKSIIGSTVKVNSAGDSIETPDYSYNPPLSNIPYRFEREGKKIFINYSKEKSNQRQLFYSLNANDSIQIYDIKNICTPWPINKGISIYTGKDTTIVFNTIKLKCWIFAEYYRRYDGLGMKNTKYLVYLEKQNLLPILKLEQNFDGSDFKTPNYLSFISQLNFLLPYDSSKFKTSSCY